MHSDELKRKALAAMPATQEEIHLKLKIALSTARAIVKDLHRAERCHIGGWKKSPSDRLCRVYHAGPGQTAPHPDGTKPRGYHAPRQTVAATVKYRDPITAALFGEVPKC